ncbi:exo-beta-N-acetylmuramidase NamZ family protein [Flavisolibacter nicotianae]|uniref:exo-beta-N-acetylmuramidase NamZ family protein n=1 Tax=Flavisolibacter nicotianae TaxID=2364882 RepID=UPI000EACED8A|nr:DUF1343 domain-containing protein [Flavisolibacter nicotianae]
MPPNALPGIDHFLKQPAYRPLRIALVTNNAALTGEGVPTRKALLQNGFCLVKLFSPEHGLTAQGTDGAFQPHGTDRLTGLPVVSLYGERLAPTEEDLRDVDAVVFDIPDIGCRFYTYLWTLTYVMESCARFGRPLLLADRPNPTGGNLALAEGPLLDEAHCSSFVGRWRMPLRHACTLGELARFFAATRLPSLELDVAPAGNWHRQIADEKSFVPTSPAIGSVHSALLYPGTGLLEGVNVNEGRGTVAPFRVCGAPWIGAGHLQKSLAERLPASVACKEMSFIAADGPYKGEHCHGVQLEVKDPALFRPVATGIALLQVLAQLYPDHLQPRAYPTRANPSGEGHLGQLLGIPGAFARIQREEVIPTDVAGEWQQEIGPYLLYGEQR